MPKESGSEKYGDWQRPFVTFRILAYRDGWKGAWDAIKAAWNRDSRLQVERDLTVSFFVKDDLIYHPVLEVSQSRNADPGEEE